MTALWREFDGDLAGQEWEAWPLWRTLNVFHRWLVGPTHPIEMRREVARVLKTMEYHFDPARAAEGGYDPDAPDWWLGDEEASHSTSLAGSKLSGSVG